MFFFRRAKRDGKSLTLGFQEKHRLKFRLAPFICLGERRIPVAGSERGTQCRLWLAVQTEHDVVVRIRGIGRDNPNSNRGTLF